MKIKRRYRFYAAHRNDGLNDKCARLHGHRYGVEVTLDLAYTHHGITTLFDDIDGRLRPIFDSLDHRTLLADADPLCDALGHSAVRFGWPTSAENLAAWLLDQCARSLPGCVELALQETDSATIVVTLDDLKEWPH
jgi:6-pyruvoyltetrahydropterin/6-carboxytetrahydropterin synthase